MARANAKGKAVYNLPPYPHVYGDVLYYLGYSDGVFGTTADNSTLSACGLELVSGPSTGDKRSARLVTLDAGWYKSTVECHTDDPYYTVVLYSRGGTYSWKRDPSNNYTFYDYATGEPFLRVVRQNTNDYRLQVNQSGSWVTK
jgi:hypothetical protein